MPRDQAAGRVSRTGGHVAAPGSRPPSCGRSLGCEDGGASVPDVRARGPDRRSSATAAARTRRSAAGAGERRARRRRAGRRRTPACPPASRCGPGSKPRSLKSYGEARMSSSRMSHASSKQSATSSEGTSGREPEGVLVEVHPGVQAARLLERRPVVATRLQGVQRPRAVGEEPERVEVGAGDPVALHDLVGAARRPAAAASRAGSLRVVARCTIAHSCSPKQPSVGVRPAVAASSRWMDSIRGSWDVEVVAETDSPRSDRRMPLESAHRLGLSAVGPLVGVLRCIGERDPPPRVPPAQGGGALGVVGEQEVVDRVLHARRAAGRGAAGPTRRPAPRAPRHAPARSGGRARPRSVVSTASDASARGCRGPVDRLPGCVSQGSRQETTPVSAS